MVDTERMACPDCGTENPMIAVLHGTRQYLCRKCGQPYYTPDSCLRPPGAVSERKDAKPATPPDSKDGKKDPKEDAPGGK
jgi:hypothetical protein